MSGKNMKLREHPLMRYRGTPNWPPKWLQHNTHGVKVIEGEMGVLKFVHARDGPSDKCVLVIEHQRELFVGILLFDNQNFCAQICSLLKAQVGRSIPDIGDLQV